ncbi:MAG: glycyl-tRNA synthetase [Acidimicrobiaceae bacterium]|nr:glycyl-tRNA synthetase [Acidimicrobiaceae bacterium]
MRGGIKATGYLSWVLTMQDAIVRLTAYWLEQGAVLAQPYNTEVGAGTLNPATFLRVLGPEPWRTAYVEPSVRPDDSRYGENPNRLQTHTQFQVILKPDPGNPQELYLGSIGALGIDTGRHDVRFVEDNWESPALGAWGLGWEVWLDGLEITQFTYFQAAGGLALEPVSVEITYGLERILMALQGVDHFKDIAFAPNISYGEIAAQAELEMSTYYLDEADVEANRQLFEIYQAEAARLLEKRLPVPAYHYVLKCSQTFNVLDSRGAIGTTERARAFARMRRLAHDVAELWVQRREELGFPLGVYAVAARPEPGRAAAGAFPAAPAPLLFEIGTEELPPADVESAIVQLQAQLAAALDTARLDHGAVTVQGTPRRIVATVTGLAPRQPDRSLTVRGPRADRAFDAEGQPTPAATGFARKQGLAVAELGRLEDGGATYLVAERVEPGRAAAEVLAELLPKLIESLRFERTMRWGAGPVAFSRPVRWLVALLGGTVVPFTYGDLVAGRMTRVLRDDEPPAVDIADAAAYPAVMAEHAITYDGPARRTVIVAEATTLAAREGGAIDPVVEAALIDEVTDLVENPVVLLGHFDERFLELPQEVLSVVMKKHQRYLPVRTPGGDLLPAFVAVANGPIEVDMVRAGNEKVLRARYADAAFFFERDLTRPLEEYRAGLATLTFEERAGSMLDRAERTAQVSAWLADRLGLPEDQRKILDRAALLAKADLGTEMVVELSTLAGQMGRIYALRQGEAPEVADAIFEHTLPRQAGDRLPESTVGAVLAIADRADALAALFAVGAQPSGSADPYGLRRAASGLVAIVLAHQLPVDLRTLLEEAARHQAVAITPAATEELLDFVRRRLEQRLLDEGHRADLVRAVLVVADRPAASVATLIELEGLLQDERFRTVATAYRRSLRIAKGVEAGPVDPSRFDDPAETALWDAFRSVAAELTAAETLGQFAERFAGLVEPINAFFEQVLVMAEDPEVRANRLRLLAQLVAPGAGFVDWNAIADL